MLRDRLPSRNLVRRLVFAGVAFALCLPLSRSYAEPQAFHLVEINKLLIGYNGNTAIQAVELKLLSGGENFVGGAFIAVYDSLGDPVATLGTFPGNVANGVAGDRILCATAAFASAFSITPDLVINPGIPMVTGQVSFEKPGCIINSLAYGNVLVRVTGTSSATPLPPHGATALVRIADNATFPSCPQAEDSAARFQLRGAGASNPHVFQNNARDTAQVWTTVTSVEAGLTPRAPEGLRAIPNPFRASTTIRLPEGASRVSVYDVTGRLVRSWDASRSDGDARAILWDGSGRDGTHQPSGLYFVEAATGAGPVRGRVLLLR
jgi:hypothetical protein